MILKTYKLEDKRYKLISSRMIDGSYLPYLCFSENRKRMAIFRKHLDLRASIMRATLPVLVDIFDCSTIDFFTDPEVLTKNSISLMSTITYPDLTRQELSKVSMKFSRE